MATVAQLGARALKKVGLTPVALVDQPSAGTVVPVSQIAARALRLLGVSQAGSGATAPSGGTVTQAAIATRALRRLAVVAADEVPATVDQTLAEEKVQAVHEHLAGNAIVTWGGTSIPLRAAEHYAIMAATLIAPAFGLPVAAGEFSSVEQSIRAQIVAGTDGQALAEVEVKAAHQTAVGLGYASWADTAIPEAVAPQYVQMTAARLGPVYGKPGDEQAYAGALALVRRFTMSGATGQALAEQKIRAVHADLSARGLTRWTLAELPDYAEEPMVMMAAEILAPDVGQPIQAGMFLAGEKMIRRLIQAPTSGGSVLISAF